MFFYAVSEGHSGDEVDLSAKKTPDRWVRVIVRLDRPGLVDYEGDLPGIPLPRRDAGGKLDVDSAEAQAYLGLLDREQEAFWQRVLQIEGRSERHHVYRVLFNGMTLKIPADKVSRISRISGAASVRSTDRVWYGPVLDASLDMIKVPEYWENTGGVWNAGQGVKVAVIDTGIDHENPFFNPAGMMYPPGFPKGAVAYTTPKVIAARAYFRPDDPVDLTRDQANPIDHDGHGSHCAGVIAGTAGTMFDVEGTLLEVSGVAPAAYLMNYKVFYRGESGSTGAREPELMAAFEDAVVDGADIISNSWGGPDVFGPWDPALEVYGNAVKAGRVVVFAAGNEGPGDGSIAAPGTYGPFITVGAVMTGRRFANFLEITAPEPVPEELQSIPMTVGRISTDVSDGFGPEPLATTTVVDGGTNVEACAPFSPGALEGKVVLVLRGGCYFSVKVQNAAAAGALAVIVRNHVPGQASFAMSGVNVSIPAVMVTYHDGQAISDWAETYSEAEVFLGGGQTPYQEEAEEGVVTAYSSRGPTAWAGLKPEVVAPGTLILSADAHRVGSALTRPWGLKSGTSMACPHVAGMAALLKGRNQSWGHHEIKAAIIGTTSPEGLRTYDGTGPAAAWERGGGLVDVSRLLDLQILADPPVLNLGEVKEWGSTLMVTALSGPGGQGGEVGQVTVRWNGDPWPEGVEVEPAEGEVVVLDSGEPVDLEIRVSVGEGVDPVDLTGILELVHSNGGDSTRLPYHVRVVPDGPEVDLLIVDMSFYAENQSWDFGYVYREAAQKAGISYEFASEVYPSDAAAVPPLPKLMRYRALLVYTGDDVGYHASGYGIRSLDRISAFAARGGGLIVIGQGPLRNTRHTRTSLLAGAGTYPDFPLYDWNTGLLVPLSEYRVFQVGKPRLITENLQLHDGMATGDLRLLGEIVQTGYYDEQEDWSSMVLRMSQGPFSGAGTVAVAYDPYTRYMVDPLAETHRHRSLFFGFGLEVIMDPANGEDEDEPGGDNEQFPPGSRAELLSRSYEWVSDRVSLDLEVVGAGTSVTFTARADAVNSEIDEYVFDFGDGNEPLYTSESVVTYEYERYGVYPVVVYAWSELDAADVVRMDVYVEPDVADQDGGVSDGDALPGDAGEHDDPWIHPGRGGCRCHIMPISKSISSAGGMTGSGFALVFLMFFGVFIFRRKSWRR